MWWQGNWGWMILGGIFTLAFWAAIIVLIVWGIRKLTEPRGGVPGIGKTALDIVKERYARGEITKEQFDQLKRDLS